MTRPEQHLQPTHSRRPDDEHTAHSHSPIDITIGYAPIDSALALVCYRPDASTQMPPDARVVVRVGVLFLTGSLKVWEEG